MDDPVDHGVMRVQTLLKALSPNTEQIPGMTHINHVRERRLRLLMDSGVG